MLENFGSILHPDTSAFFFVLGAVLSVRARETIIEIWFNYNKNDTLKGQVVKSLATILDLDQSTFFFKDNAISLQV